MGASACNGSRDNPSVVSAVSAMFSVIGAASGHRGRGRASHNPPVVGSSPTRPTRNYTGCLVDGVEWCQRRLEREGWSGQ